ncbi:MAG TPA: DUF58 domain-containing protein [Bacteroidales bacterium]|nr:DUF58 domain-containing protein [Bacteroidales bacterium]HOH23076.1 DUF58 domain-containing protein [Bacteroidales bacterium]HPB58365.1 DUF58 domain-containing protein [Bacteroidales bacterium]HPZ03104.1 DUF58 domain-containing protein [Bacteroidales bacterium]HQB74726.1 DUF58 domain-containing protein [Bacteroidales bacterium]
MDSVELIKKIRKIEIRTRKITQQIFSGQYHSAFKGRGMTFSEVREYQYGDDIRNIDWNVTARFNHPYVKVFEEERELTVMLLIDISASTRFGTRVQQKSDLITELAAVLSFSAISNNDKVGVIFFTNRVEKFIPPKKGRTHILRIIRELIDFKPQETETNIDEALRYLTNALKKRVTVFMLSDFVSKSFEKSLRIASNKHDITALQLTDPQDGVLPNMGLIKLKDAETGAIQYIDSSDRKARERYRHWWHSQQQYSAEQFTKVGVDYAQIHTHLDYVSSLKSLFQRRSASF